MTARLAQAARNARYLLQVYSQFGKPIPHAMVENVNRELVEALEEYDACQVRGNSVAPAPRPVKWINDGKGHGWENQIDIAEWAGQ